MARPPRQPMDQDRNVIFSVSTADGITPVPLEVNPITGRLIVDSTGTVTNSGIFPVQLNASQSNTTGAITASGQSVTDTDLVGVGAVTVQLSGTYSGFNGIFETLVTGTSWVPIRAQIVDESAIPTTTTGVLPNNTTVIYNISPLYGNSSIRLRATALTSGQVDVVIAPSAQFGEQSVASMIYDGTNIVNVLKSDGTAAGQNAELVAGTGMSSATLTLNVGSPATAWFDMLNYSWVSVEILTNAQPATLTWQTSGDASQTNIRTMPLFDSQGIAAAGSTTTTSAVATLHGPRIGRYFRVSSNVSGANTVTLVITFYTMPTALNTFGVMAAQSGTWTVGSNSATGSAVPANAFYIAGVRAGNLTGIDAQINSSDSLSVSSIGLAAQSYNLAYNGGSWDRMRPNITGFVITAGATSPNAGVNVTTYNTSKAVILINVSAYTSGSLTVTVNGVSLSGYTYPILASTALAATGVTPLRIFPGSTPSANAVANDMVPRTLQVVVTGTFVATYGIDYELSV